MPQNVFLVLAFTFGILFQLTTPPFQSPDEFNHFYRAYQVADGQWTPLNYEKRLGGFVPESFIEIQDIFMMQRYDTTYTIDRAEIKEKTAISLNKNQTIFVDFPNTALYSPVSYLPQAISIFICKELDVAPINMLYISRFATFFFWLFCIYTSIKILPIYKWLFSFLALLPISIFIHSTLSADTVTNAFAFLMIAFALHCVFKIERFTYKHLFIFVLLAVILALSKLIYVALIFLFFLIPKEKFRSKKEFFILFLAILAVAFIVAQLWTNIIFEHYIPYTHYNKEFGPYLDLPKRANIPEHQKFIFHNPFYFLKILGRTLLYSNDMYLPSYIGRLGCLDIDLPAWCYYVTYLLILFLAVFENDKLYKFSPWQKIVLFSCAMFLFTLLVYSQLVSFDFIGVYKVNVVQGRYLIPVFPLLFLLFNQFKIKIKQSFYLIPFVFIAAILFLSFTTLKKRYFCHTKKHITTTYWNKKSANTESSNKNYIQLSEHLFTRSVYLSDTNSISKSIIYDNCQAIKLYNKFPYSCTFSMYDAKKGDVLYAEMLKKGNSATIVFAATSIKNLFVSSTRAVYKNNEGWVKTRLFYTLEADYKNTPVKIFLWNPSEKDTAFVSDFKIKISRFNKKN